MKKIALFILCGLLTQLTYSQRDFSKVEITSTKVDSNFYMLQGSGGNILVYIGSEEVLMIDSQFAPLSEKIGAKISELAGDRPIKYLINTHYHGDHTGGNANFNSADIVAHQNVKERLSKDQFIKAFQATVEAKPKSFWPDIVYTNRMELQFDSTQILLLHHPNGHTDGDTQVAFMEKNIVHMGDTFFKDRFPYIDLSSGGTIDGYIASVKSALFYMDQNTKIIPGHGDLASFKDLENYLEMLKTLRKRVAQGIEEGKSIEELKKADLDEGYEVWGTGFINAESFIDTIWTDLTRGKND